MYTIPTEIIENHIGTCYRVYTLIRLTCKTFYNLKRWENLKNIQYHCYGVHTRFYFIRNLKYLFDNVYPNTPPLSIIGEKFTIKVANNSIFVYFQDTVIAVTKNYGNSTSNMVYKLCNQELIGNNVVIHNFCNYLLDNYPEFTKDISLTKNVYGYNINF